MKKRTLITSALPYANGFIHLGHSAGAYLPADLYARFLRLNAEDVLYVCGSDEHGVAITISADNEKTTPQAIIDKYHYSNSDAFDKFGMTFDIYSRTSLPEHHETAREFFQYYLDNDYLVEKEEAQFYDETAGMFLPDRYVEGICPNCGFEQARGDQCDKCGAYYNQTELKNPISIVSGKAPIVKKTNHWYMRFDMFQEFLEEYVESHAKDWKDNVLQQTRSWLKQGMAPRAITRDLTWGVSMKGIKGLDDAKTEGKALYVWFDAVLGYITFTKIWCREHNDNWEKWWKDSDTEYIAFIGKDNIVFHTIIFPALLHGRKDFILPTNVPANEFLNLEGQKLSKSRGWTIELHEFLSENPSAQHVDALRYCLTSNLPETKDSDFTWKDYQAKNNNELAAILGNFANRVLVFLGKNFDLKTPTLADKYKSYISSWNKAVDELVKNQYSDESLLKSAEILDGLDTNAKNLLISMFSGIRKTSDCYRRFRFRDALNESMNIARAANKFFNDEEPWKTAKADLDTCGKTVFICIQVLRTLAVVFAPLMPHISKEIFETLNLENQYTGEANSGNPLKENEWFLSAKPLIEENHAINTPKILFSQIDDEWLEKQIAKLGNKTAPAKEKPVFEEITIDDFAKIKLRTALIISAENVPKSKKLIKMQVDLGWEKRQILAGVAEHYKPSDLVGKTIVVVVNLKPAKLMGQESNGMMLCASTEDGKLFFVSPTGEVGPGEEVR
jgi:methionyl-tRNA synthetase